MIFNRLLAWEVCWGRILLLFYASRLISKNLPVRPEAAARVMPPTQPGVNARSFLQVIFARRW